MSDDSRLPSSKEETLDAFHLRICLTNVAVWLENGCEPAIAAKELRILIENVGEPPSVVETECYRVCKDLMHVIYNALQDYANEATYWAPRIGGVAQGCPRGEPPTPAQLTVNAALAVRMIDREVLGRSSAVETTENPGAGAPGGVGVVDLAARSTAIPLVNLPPIKAGDKCAHCGERWLLSLDGKGMWHNCHTGIPSKTSRSFRQTSFHNSGPGDRCDHCSMPINEHSDGMYYCPEKASDIANPADFPGGPLEYPEDFDAQ